MSIINDIATLYDELNRWAGRHPWIMATILSVFHAFIWRIIHQNMLGYFNLYGYILGCLFGIVIYYVFAGVSVLTGGHLE